MVSNKLLTLVFVRQVNQILLGLKKRGFGEGRWNGFGGKVQAGESIEQGASRELHEEAGIIANNLNKIGVLMFEFIGDPQLMEVHVFSTDLYKGEPTESEEMRPQWYGLADIPFRKMWPDDILWFPIMLRGSKFYGYFRFQGMDNIIGHTLKEVPCLDSISIPKAPLSSDIDLKSL